MRSIFADRFNSLVHFVLGVLAVKFRILIFLFGGYQILESIILVDDPNFFIDILEFVLGMCLSFVILKAF
jgi:hypothetical protein